MLNFTTLFDSNYMSRGLALYQSLVNNCNSFHLYIFAFDNQCYEELNNMALIHSTVIGLCDFEDNALLSIKGNRTQTEYCWTSSGKTIEYVMDHFNKDLVTYIDADIFFFMDPKEIFNQMKNNSVIITPHRYSKQYDQTDISGKYCVQFVSFRNDIEGRKVLNWWITRCIEWCYNRVEDKRFGDQKYLDYFMDISSKVVDMVDFGVGLAPWNCQQYTYKLKKDIEISINKDTYNLIFFHFHGMKFDRINSCVLLSRGYEIPRFVKKRIYLPYIKQIQNIENNGKKNNEFSLDDFGRLRFTDLSSIYIYNYTRKILILFEVMYNELYYISKKIYSKIRKHVL